MKILLIMTGGTICSFENERGERAADTERAEAFIVNNFKNGDSVYRDDVQFEVKSPLNILSENMTVTSWNTLVTNMKKYKYEEYDGVIILHGTDTLAYTSALLSLLMSGADVPVFLVSSQLPIYMEEANGNENFKTAVELIAKGVAPNVYAVYRNGDGIYVHLASHLLQCTNNSWEFYSYDMKRLEDFVGVASPRGDMPLYKCGGLTPSVLKVSEYVGIDYNRFSLDGVRAVLHGTYHSSTLAVDTESERYSALSLIDRCRSESIPFFIHPCDSEAYDYESTGKALRHGAIALNGITAEMAYVKLLVGIACGYDGEMLVQYMKNEINGEFIR